VIPFNRANLEGRELEYLQQAIDGGHISGGGPFTRAVEEHLEQLHQGARTLLTTSCTHALEMASLLAGLGPGDEVIVPSYTFVSSASAFLIHQAVPVFVDVDPDTLNLDLDAVTRAIGPRTKAVCAVHYGGVGARPDELARLCEDHDLTLIEDNAHGLFGRFRGEPLGTFGSISTLSFHETKNITCGEGGALLINDPAFVERAEILREKGTDRSRFFRGLVDKYSWVDIGSSYVLSDVLAAFLLAQLEVSQQIQTRREQIWNDYDQHLRDWARENGVQTPFVPAHCDQPYHMYYLLLPSEQARDAFLAELRRQGVYSVFHYLPLHLSSMGRRLGGQPGDCPVTEDISGRLARLPFHTTLAEDAQRYVVDVVRRFRC
jgi:dTDP-4-amino-4,6-dideoxygalactose transaminase